MGKEIRILIKKFKLNCQFRKKKCPLWASAFIIALLVPVIVYSFVALGIDYFKRTNTDPDNTGEGIAFVGGFIALVLAFNAIVMFVIGVILNIYTFIKREKRYNCTGMRK